MHDLLPLRRPRQLAEYNEQGEKSMLTVTHDVLANYFKQPRSLLHRSFYYSAGQQL
jgi:hypothetical protein